MNLWIVFFTGLTTGGLTCLALQGGLLASALTQQMNVADQRRAQERKARKKGAARTQNAAPTQHDLLVELGFSRYLWGAIYFLAAKLAAHFVLGFLLGTIGASLALTPTVHAALQIVAALFMLAAAANLLNLHPIFRYAVIQPPKVFTRLVRNQTRSEQVFAPALLGVATVLIPCGTTQAMEALAITAGNGLSGALIMGTFVLGTAPAFLGLGFLTTQTRNSRTKATFNLVAALLILAMAVVSIDGGLNLLGVPYTPSRALAATFSSNETGGTAQIVDGRQEMVINVLSGGYAPNVLRAAAAQPIRLRLETRNNYTCTSGFVIPRLGIQRVLPPTGETVVDLPAQPAGPLYFTCSMGMYSGVIYIQ
jgi:sulfite exporter TauE/SafE